jgi:hypothetical protein
MAVIEHPPDPHPVEHAVKHPGRPGATESAATDKSHRLDLAHLSRRGFLIVGGAAFLAACSSSASKTTGSVATATSINFGRFSSDPYVLATPQRFAFVVEQGVNFLSNPDVNIRFQAPGGPWTPYERATLHTEGLDQGKAIFTAPVTFTAAGTWTAQISTQGKTATGAIPVTAKPQAVAVGDPAPTVASPTIDHSLHVDPICTRSPMCPLHDQSLSDLIAKGKPTAVIFATPARCQSRYCAPSLNMVLAEMKPVADKINVVHVEIYQNNQTDALISTVDAWHLASEPFLYGVNAAGTVVNRLDGAFGQDEVRTLLQTLA